MEAYMKKHPSNCTGGYTHVQLVEVYLHVYIYNSIVIHDIVALGTLVFTVYLCMKYAH